MLGPGSSIKGVRGVGFAVQSTRLLSYSKFIRPDSHLQSRTSRRPVPLYQDGQESMCSMTDLGQSQSLGTRLSLSEWSTSLGNGCLSVAGHGAST